MATEKRLIDANALLKVLKHRVRGNEDSPFVIGTNNILAIFGDFVLSRPVVDAVEVVHGRWVPTYHTYYNKDGASEIADELHCSECGIYSRIESNYCPNCGAKNDI